MKNLALILVAILIITGANAQTINSETSKVSFKISAYLIEIIKSGEICAICSKVGFLLIEPTILLVVILNFFPNISLHRASGSGNLTKTPILVPEQIPYSFTRFSGKF